MNQLQHRYDAPENPQVNTLPYNVPFVPRIEGEISPSLAPFIQPVVIKLVTELQQNAPRNALRMYLLNQMAANNYNNQDFQNLTLSAMDLLNLYLMQGQQAEQASTAATQEITAMISAVNAKSFPELMATVRTAAEAQSVDELVNRYYSLGNAIEQATASQQPAMGMAQPAQQYVNMPQQQYAQNPGFANQYAPQQPPVDQYGRPLPQVDQYGRPLPQTDQFGRPIGPMGGMPQQQFAQPQAYAQQPAMGGVPPMHNQNPAMGGYGRVNEPVHRSKRGGGYLNAAAHKPNGPASTDEFSAEPSAPVRGGAAWGRSSGPSTEEAQTEGD